MNRILVIQTAFIGDAILGTALLEKLNAEYPQAKIDYLVRNGNQSLFRNHPFLNEVLIWDKASSKYAGLWQLLKQIRSKKYDAVFNIQRYAASGILTAFSGAKVKVGYQSNPLSFLFSKSIGHRFGKGYESVHEVDRVLDLAGSTNRVLPKLYPSQADELKTKKYASDPFITIAPASVWFTKQFPVEKWLEFINSIEAKYKIYLIGGPSDQEIASQITSAATRKVDSLVGELSLLETAALMQKAVMNYANDSAPVHITSAINAPVTEVFCSTVPEFGFMPISDKSSIVQANKPLDCRPCGIHGKTACPRGHFKCAMDIETEQLLATLPKL
jgi:heptosyltransferase-2